MQQSDLRADRTKSRLGFLPMLGAALVAALVTWFVWDGARSEAERVRAEIRENADVELAKDVEHVEDALKQIYQNLRTISFLPDVRQQSYGAFATPDASALQQIYNNLATNVAVSQVSLSGANFDPSRIDPITGRPETPALIVEQIVTGKDAPPGATTEGGQAAQALPQNVMIARQISYLREHYPVRTSFDGLDVPIIAGEDIPTLDRTDGDTNPEEEDRMGVVFSMPFYSLAGDFAGVVSVVVRNNVFRELLPEKDATLTAPAIKLSIMSKKPGTAESDAAKGGVPDPDLFYSKTAEIALQDPKGAWLLWQGISHAEVDADPRVKAIGNRLVRDIAIVILVLLGILALNHWISRRYIGPITRLSEAIVSISHGDLDPIPPHASRQDLIGQISRAVDGFRRNAIVVREAEEARTELARQAEEMRRSEAERAQYEQAQWITASLGKAIGDMASGNLDARVHVDLGAGFGMLREDFNRAGERLGTVMADILEDSHFLTIEVGSISSATRDLANRTITQVESLRTAGALLKNINESVEQQNGLAQEIADAMAESRREVGQVKTVAVRAVGSINRVAESTAQIRRFTTIIDEMAVQTNMLALNAGIEAARAGQHGRGFALVAGEVRNLAHKSAEAAREIRGLVDASARDVDAGVVAITNTDQALQAILTSVEQTAAVSRDIRDNANLQDRKIAEINLLVDNLNMTTEQNAAMVEQSSAATETLVRQLDRLRDMIGYFHVGKTRNAGSRAA